MTKRLPVELSRGSLEDVLSEAFPDIGLESFTINETQRIILVGFAIKPALEQMIEWLSVVYEFLLTSQASASDRLGTGWGITINWDTH